MKQTLCLVCCLYSLSHTNSKVSTISCLCKHAASKTELFQEHCLIYSNYIEAVLNMCAVSHQTKYIAYKLQTACCRKL